MAKEATTTEKTAQAVKNLRSDARQLAIEAERLLRHYAKLDKGNTAYPVHVDPGHAFVLRSAGFNCDYPEMLRREFGRIYLEAELAEKAGKPDEYDAVQLEADELTKEYNTKSKELTPKIQALQRELQEADIASRHAVGKRDSMAEARRQLRDVMPPFTKAIVEYEKQRARLALEGKERSSCENKCAKIVDQFVEAACVGTNWVEMLELVGE